MCQERGRNTINVPRTRKKHNQGVTRNKDSRSINVMVRDEGCSKVRLGYTVYIESAENNADAIYKMIAIGLYVVLPENK